MFSEIVMDMCKYLATKKVHPAVLKGGEKLISKNSKLDYVNCYICTTKCYAITKNKAIV